MKIYGIIYVSYLLFVSVTGVMEFREPYMGWSSWSLEATKYPGYGSNWLNQSNVLQQAEVMYKRLLKYGYKYVNLDSGWSDGVDGYGRFKMNTNTFPIGLKGLADVLHGKGLKLGVYLIPGVSIDAYNKNLPVYGSKYRHQDFAIPISANAFEGSRYKINFTKPGGQEWVDAQVDYLAKAGVDFIKLDAVVPGSSVKYGSSVDCTSDVEAYSKAIHKSGRKIWLTISWAINNTLLDTFWRKSANAWRVATDVETYGEYLVSFYDVARNAQALSSWMSSYNPGVGYQDMDSLLIGNGTMSTLNKGQRKIYMTYWVIASSPLYSGDDLTKVDEIGWELLTNPEVIAIHKRAKPAKMIGAKFNETQVWYSNHDDGVIILALFNLDPHESDFSVDLKEVGAQEGKKYRVRDVWNRKTLDSIAHTGSKFEQRIASHDVGLYLLLPALYA